MDKKMCLLTIKSCYNTLTAVEKTVADYILKNSEEVISMPIAVFAENANVAKSAVIRCCKSLGFDGYSDMKLALAMELSKNKKLNYTPYIDPSDDAGAIMDKVFTANVKTLHDTAEKIDRDVLQKIVDVLSNANVIYVYGIGTSAGIAGEFQYRLMQIGKTALCVNDVPTMKVSTLNIRKGDVAVGISHSGRTIATIEALRLAKRNGAETICITSYPDSEITKNSDYPIEIYSDEIDYPVEATSSRIAHLSMIDVITIAMSSRNYGDALERARKTHDLVNTIRY
ncbi:MAG: MurR/RpiR family transcriptional regulator [Lachnospiraceae bacterium]|nr:MurR/RpiR family transcriptional regulator [Lachnospiraceae bacterium]